MMKSFIFAILAIFLLNGCGDDKGKFIIQNTSSKGFEETTLALKKALENQTFTALPKAQG